MRVDDRLLPGLREELLTTKSQNAAHEGTATGQRYVQHQDRGSRVLRFVRETDTRPNGAGDPFTFLGPVSFVASEGGRPMQITWRLHHPLPQVLLDASRLIDAA